MIIDAYTHGIHGGHVEPVAKAGGAWAKKTLDRMLLQAKVKPHYIDVIKRVEQLDRNGFDRQVVTPLHRLDVNLMAGGAADHAAFSAALNDNMARLVEDSKGRLSSAATISLCHFEDGGRKEMERSINGLGLKAVQLCTNFNGKPIDLPEFEQFWAQAARMNVPVYIHPNDPAGYADRSYEAEYDMIHNFGWPYETVLTLSRLVFSGIMERYPDLKVISHHLGGGMIPFFWGRINETYAPECQQATIGRVLPKPLFEYFSRFYYDTAVGGSVPAIKCAYDVFGIDRIIFATDSPWGPGSGEARLARYPSVVRAVGLTEAENEQIFAGNVSTVLNLT